MTACEIEGGARKQLIDALRRDTQARVVDLDGWTALPAFVPPNERRGVVLIDPSFEQKDEFERLADGFAEAYAKWPTGSYLIWYPVKSRRAADTLAREIAQATAAAKTAGACLRLEFSVAPQETGGPLTSTGLLMVNPPWTLRAAGLGGGALFALLVFPRLLSERPPHEPGVLPASIARSISR